MLLLESHESFDLVLNQDKYVRMDCFLPSGVLNEQYTSKRKSKEHIIAFNLDSVSPCRSFHLIYKGRMPQGLHRIVRTSSKLVLVCFEIISYDSVYIPRGGIVSA